MKCRPKTREGGLGLVYDGVSSGPLRTGHDRRRVRLEDYVHITELGLREPEASTATR